MNKLENTLENKARFFAQYLLQNVFIETKDTTYPMTILGIDSEMGAHVFDRGIQLRSYYTVEHGTLLLTPLSQISDDDAIEVAKLAFGQSKFERNIKITNTTNRHFGFSFYHNSVNGDSLEYQIDFNGFYNPTLICLSRNTLPQEYIHNIQKIVDYLRSRGYALPFMGLSVDDLVSYGWVKLREVNHG